MTLSIKGLIVTHDITTFSIMTLVIMILSIKELLVTLSIRHSA
jgi:hypothetical protein